MINGNKSMKYKEIRSRAPVKEFQGCATYLFLTSSCIFYMYCFPVSKSADEIAGIWDLSILSVTVKGAVAMLGH